MVITTYAISAAMLKMRKVFRCMQLLSLFNIFFGLRECFRDSQAAKVLVGPALMVEPLWQACKLSPVAVVHE
jgi:hypothetical protein